MKFKNLISILIINFSIVCFLVSIIEILSRKFESNNTVVENAFNNKKLIAYKEFEYQYELLDDDCNRNYFMVSDGDDIYFADKNFNCPGVSVKEGKRYTLGNNDTAKIKIHIYGGSTVFGTGSIDSHTIPSLIQKYINENIGAKYTVINHGFASLVTKQQLSKLRKTDINKDDIVIFYDGGNDAFLSYIYENMDGTIVGFNRKNKISFLFSRLRFYLSKRSSFYRFLSKLKNNKTSINNEAFCGPPFNESKANKYVRNYLSNINLAREYTNKNDAKFFHFLQPVLGSGGLLIEDNYYPDVLLNEVKFNSNVLFDKCLITNFSNYYQFKSKKYRESKKEFNNDLSLIFKNNLKPQSHYFIDHIHITPIASEIVANKISEVVVKQID